MSDKNTVSPQLARKEIKLIKLLRLQSKEIQQQIIDDIDKTYKEWIQNGRDNNINEESESQEDAYWLNSEHYKK